jgi:hypothetical protein
MNESQKLQLHELMKQNNTVDNTHLIRELKHSVLLRENIEHMMELKRTVVEPERSKRCEQECYFLYEKYTALYHRLYKNRVDLSVLNTFLHVLAKIEEGLCTQQEASFEIGTLLKHMYVDPELEKKEPTFKPAKNIQWQEYKQKMLSSNR